MPRRIPYATATRQTPARPVRRAAASHFVRVTRLRTQHKPVLVGVRQQWAVASGNTVRLSAIRLFVSCLGIPIRQSEKEPKRDQRNPGPACGAACAAGTSPQQEHILDGDGTRGGEPSLCGIRVIRGKSRFLPIHVPAKIPYPGRDVACVFFRWMHLALGNAPYGLLNLPK